VCEKPRVTRKQICPNRIVEYLRPSIKIQRVKCYFFIVTCKRSRAQLMNNGDFIVRFKLTCPVIDLALPYPPITTPTTTTTTKNTRRKGKREERDACEPCTYVSVNDEDYRSFLAAGKSLRLLSGLPFLPSNGSKRPSVHTSEPTLLRGFIIPFRFSLLPSRTRDSTYKELRNDVYEHCTQYTPADIVTNEL